MWMVEWGKLQNSNEKKSKMNEEHRYSMFMDRKTQYCQVVIQIWSIDAMQSQLKFQQLFVNTDQLILKFIQGSKRPRMLFSH